MRIIGSVKALRNFARRIVIRDLRSTRLRQSGSESLTDTLDGTRRPPIFLGTMDGSQQETSSLPATSFGQSAHTPLTRRLRTAPSLARFCRFAQAFSLWLE